MTTFAELINDKIQVPIGNFKESILKDLNDSREALSLNTVTYKDGIERLEAKEKASQNVLIIFNTLMDTMGFNEESSMLFIGTVQAKQREIDQLKLSKVFKETEYAYYTDIITNYYVLISEVGNILGDVQRSLGFDYEMSEQESHAHAHSHEESCSCEHCHV